MPLVSSGVENGNLRQLALERMKDFGAECRDVRYREVGVSLGLVCNVLCGVLMWCVDVRDSQSGPTDVCRAPAS